MRRIRNITENDNNRERIENKIGKQLNIEIKQNIKNKTTNKNKHTYENRKIKNYKKK